MVARLYFMSSLPTISTVRTPLVAAAAGFSVPAAGFCVAAGFDVGAAGLVVAGVCAAAGDTSMIERIRCWYITVPRNGPVSAGTCIPVQCDSGAWSGHSSVSGTVSATVETHKYSTL